MPNLETAVKATESLADWSKWLVTLEMAAIGTAPYFLGEHKNGALLLKSVDCILVAALCCFFISVVAGTVVLGNIPLVLTKIANKPDATVDIHNQLASPFGFLRARIWMFAGLEHVFFIFGTLWIVVYLWLRK